MDRIKESRIDACERSKIILSAISIAQQNKNSTEKKVALDRGEVVRRQPTPAVDAEHAGRVFPAAICITPVQLQLPSSIQGIHFILFVNVT